MSKKLTAYQGFTLIELLVVMGIIALVFASAISFAESLGQKSDNAKRESDLRVLQSILQQYKADQGFYPCSEPDPTNCPDPLDLSAGGEINNNIGNPNPVTNPITYLNEIPVDPIADVDHCYIYKAYISKNNLAVCNNDHTTNPQNDPSRNCHYYRLMTIQEGSTTTITSPEKCAGGALDANFEVHPN